MVNPFKEVNWNPDTAALRTFARSLVAGVLFYAAPVIAKPFYIVWYAFACCIGLVVGNVLLGLIFYVLVTGIGLLKRLGGRQAIRKTPDPQAGTYWVDAPPAPEPKRYYRQF